MNHDNAVNTQSAVKYLLGELRPAERDAFEQHYFKCRECADEVRLGAYFRENAREEFRQEARARFVPARTKGARDWFAWMRPAMLAPMAAGLALMIGSGYQNAVVIPALRGRLGAYERPQAVASTVLAPASRSATPVITIDRSAPFFQLSLAPGGAAPAASLRCELRSESGKSLATVPVSQLEPDAIVALFIPTAIVSDGYYKVVLFGMDGGAATELDQYVFEVRRK
jgi:anti-sigma factor RsiW